MATSSRSFVRIDSAGDMVARISTTAASAAVSVPVLGMGGVKPGVCTAVRVGSST